MSINNPLINLFQKLNHQLDIYIKAYTTYRLLLKKEDLNSKKESALEQMQDALLMISDIINKIDSYYKEETRNFVSDISKEDLEIIDDEYIETLNRIDNIELSLSLKSLQKFPEIVENHKKLLNRFSTMENNIEYYNKRANLGFKIISPEEAHKHYDNLKKQIRENRAEKKL